MISTFYDNLPADKKPRTRRNTVKELYFADINSRYVVMTAGARGVGRGLTVSNWHASECASYTEAEKVFTSMGGSLTPNANVIIESTAEGIGNLFETTYNEAKRGESSYRAHFFAWFLSKEYRADPASVAPFPPGEQKRAEDQARELFGLDEEQLAWRRKTLRGPAAKTFKQEFPATDTEAFLTSSAGYFDAEILQALRQKMLDRPRPTLSGAVIANSGIKRRLLRAIDDNELVIYQAPQPGRNYVIGADTAEGTKDGDADSAQVLDRESGQQVASISCRVATHVYGALLDELGRWYNEALIGVERNNHGHSVLNTLINACEYPNLYYHIAGDEETPEEEKKKPGFPTTAPSKILILDGLDEAITQGTITIHKLQTIEELTTFVRLKDGKAGGDGKHHDDEVMSLAIAEYMRAQPVRKTWADVFAS
jgi:hypothetical protein